LQNEQQNAQYLLGSWIELAPLLYVLFEVAFFLT
jgi:hypothetical protein